jgi:hypothetical protein
MGKYAVVKDELVINTVIADSAEDVELLDGEMCIEYDEEDVSVGGTYDGIRFIPTKPYPSWILNSNFKWEPPTGWPTPSGDSSPSVRHEWNEEDLAWDEIPVP